MNAIAPTSTRVDPPLRAPGTQLRCVQVRCASGASCRLVLAHGADATRAELSKLADIVFARPRTVRRVDPALAKHLGWSLAMVSQSDVAELRRHFGLAIGSGA